MKKKIVVTNKEIKRGKRCSLTCCPIALAAQKSGLRGVSVMSDHILYFISGIGYMFFDLPMKAQSFIYNFDIGEKVKPFSFVLRSK